MPQNQFSNNNASKNDALIQGEGNYTAATEYDDATREFIKSGKVKEAADNAAPKNAEGAKALLAGLGSPAAIDAFLAIDPSSVAANNGADTSGYNKIQAKSAELVGAAKNIAQFLDRDTSPDFVSNVIGEAFANFVADPTQVDSILAGIEEQKSTYLS